MPRGPVTHPRSQGQHLGVSMPARTLPCMLGCSPHWFLSWDLAPRNPFQVYIYSQRRTSPAVLSLLVSRRSPGHQLLDRGELIPYRLDYEQPMSISNIGKGIHTFIFLKGLCCKFFTIRSCKITGSFFHNTTKQSCRKISKQLYRHPKPNRSKRY